MKKVQVRCTDETSAEVAQPFFFIPDGADGPEVPTDNPGGIARRKLSQAVQFDRDPDGCISIAVWSFLLLLNHACERSTFALQLHLVCTLHYWPRA